MKRTIKILAVLLAMAVPVLLFVGCSSDDNDEIGAQTEAEIEAEVESALVGIWVEDTTAEHDTYHLQLNSDFTGSEWITVYGSIISEVSFTWKATAENIIVTKKGITTTQKYILDGDRLTIYPVADGEIITYIRE